jgi:tRNA G18 (ribose-2'-O)-methylase SpoU
MRCFVASQRTGAADAAVAIPMLGMANSLNVATAAAILLYWLSLHFEETGA